MISIREMTRRLAIVAIVAIGACKNDPSPPPRQVPADASAPAGDENGWTYEPPLGGGAPPAGLLLTIDAVHDREQPREQPPWHGPGGDWTFLDLRTPGGATFTAGFGFFNYSIADKKAAFSTKDEDYNPDIVADFAAALRDGH